MARVTFVTSGLEHLGVGALMAYVKRLGHEAELVYEPKLFSSNSGPDSALLARLFEPTPDETAARVLATAPDVVAFSTYTITHRWAVEVARAVKRARPVPVVFGGPHVSGAPARALREASIDAVVEGEGEGALADLLACTERGRFGRTDVANVWFRTADGVVSNRPRALVDDLDALPFVDREGFYRAVPAFERELYVMARRGCPYRCSFCEYSTFPSRYGGERAVRRRSVANLMTELSHWKARGRVRKVFFWDAIFTLDPRWIDEFAELYRAEIALPFECYTHPQTMTEGMAAALGRAGCVMVRVGVQSVNADTLAAMDRRGDRERVARTVRMLDDHGVPHALDHIVGIPGETADDQREALRFYNDLRPRYIHVHWMTYFPGTTALDRAAQEGVLAPAQVDRILDGEVTEGFEAPRLVGPGAHRDELDEIQRLLPLFELIPLLPREVIRALLDRDRYKLLPGRAVARQLATALITLSGSEATRERMRTLLLGTLWTLTGPRLRALLEGILSAAPSPPATNPPSPPPPSPSASPSAPATERAASSRVRLPLVNTDQPFAQGSGSPRR